MRRKLWLPLLAGLLAVGACYAYFTYVPWISASEFRAQVEREIPPGTSRQEASAWLRSKGYLSHDLSPNCRRSEGCVHLGEFSNYRIDGIFPTVLRFEIAFDDNGRRTRHLNVEEFTYGL